MPIDIASDVPLTPAEQFAARAAANVGQPTPTASPDPAPWGQMIADSFTRDTVVGSLFTDFIPYHVAAGQAPSDRDPTFDPYKLYNRPEFFDAHPYMTKPFLDGTIDDVPNQQRFDLLLARTREDYEIRERLGTRGFTGQLLSSIPGQVIDAITGGVVLRSLGLAGKVATLGEWAQKGGITARVVKNAGLAAGINLAQEEALRALNPTRNVDERQAALWALGMGAAFGGAVPFFAGGVSKLGDVATTARVQAMQKQVAEALSDSKMGEVADIEARDVSALQELKASGPVDSIGAASPTNVGIPPLRPTGVTSYTVLQTPKTNDLIREIKAAYGDRVDFVHHPMQDYADAHTILMDLEESLSKSRPADLGLVGNALTKVLGAVSPAGKVLTTPSRFAREAGRLLFDFSVGTQEGKAFPVSTEQFTPAEGHLWTYRAFHDEARLGIESALRDGLKQNKGGFIYTTSQGDDLVIRSAALDRPAFFRAVTDYTWRIDEHARRPGSAPPDAPDAVKKGAGELQAYFEKMGRDAADIGLFTPDTGRPYFRQQWQTEKIRLNSADFKARLIRQWQINRQIDFRTGKYVVADNRPLVPDAIEHGRKGQVNGLGLTEADRKAISDYAVANDLDLKDINESLLAQALGPDILARYLDEIDIYQSRAADSTIRTLLDLDNAHGVPDSMLDRNASALKERILDVDPTRFSDYLESDAGRMLASYDSQMAGRLATRRAIKLAESTWGPRVKEATGKILADELYDPSLIIETVKKDFNRWIEAVRPGPMRDKLAAAMETMTGDKSGILTAKLAELEHGGSPPGVGQRTGWALFLERNALRMPFLANMGKMTISAFNDLASHALLKRMGPNHVRTTTRLMESLRNETPRGLESLYVAMADQVRGLRGAELGDVMPAVERARFGRGPVGKALAATDEGLSWLQAKFVTATGMNKWNSMQKRMVATRIQQEIIDGARKLSVAQRLMDAGMTEAKALEKSGIAPEDATRLSRLGINGNRAKRLMDIIDAHGVDYNGNRVNHTHQGFIGIESSKWWKQDRDLFDSLSYAVNAETMNLIVEPKVLSRPLFNNTLVGRLFNQFQSWGMAWGTQLAPVALQRPGHELAMYVSLAVGLGGLVDAIHNQLSGRRDLSDTIKLWGENPAGMLYAAVNRSGLFGWLARPIGLLENTPYGIAKNLGNDQLSTMSGRPQDMIDQLGPFFSWSNRLWKGVLQPMYDGQSNDQALRQLWGAVPFRNLWAVEGAFRLFEAMGYDAPDWTQPRPRPDSP